jgi:3-hydroxybutyryl-CoA dehydrogenase
MEIKRVGVVGCGLMGSGIAQVCAQAGYDVTVSETERRYLDKGLDSIGKFLAKSVEKGKISGEDREATLGRIRGTTELRDLAESDVVIEAVPERLDLKKKIFVELDEMCQPHTILASNTSGFSILELGVATKRLDNVVGMHFFNPVPLMKLVEVIRSLATSDETAETAKALGESLGKAVVIAKDTPGFIVNRLSMALTINAIRMLESGIATREDIDAACTQGLNHPMGPLTVADFAGIDTLYYAVSDMYAKTQDPIFAPPVLLQQMVAAGWVGRKAGKGFYDYR